MAGKQVNQARSDGLFMRCRIVVVGREERLDIHAHPTVVRLGEEPCRLLAKEWGYSELTPPNNVGVMAWSRVIRPSCHRPAMFGYCCMSYAAYPCYPVCKTIYHHVSREVGGIEVIIPRLSASASASARFQVQPEAIATHPFMHLSAARRVTIRIDSPYGSRYTPSRRAAVASAICPIYPFSFVSSFLSLVRLDIRAWGRFPHMRRTTETSQAFMELMGRIPATVKKGGKHRPPRLLPCGFLPLLSWRRSSRTSFEHGEPKAGTRMQVVTGSWISIEHTIEHAAYQPS